MYVSITSDDEIIYRVKDNKNNYLYFSVSDDSKPKKVTFYRPVDVEFLCFVEDDDISFSQFSDWTRSLISSRTGLKF